MIVVVEKRLDLLDTITKAEVNGHAGPIWSAILDNREVLKVNRIVVPFNNGNRFVPSMNSDEYTDLSVVDPVPAARDDGQSVSV